MFNLLKQLVTYFLPPEMYIFSRIPRTCWYGIIETDLIS